MSAAAPKQALGEGLIARSPAMRALKDDLLRLCEVKSPVLIEGESGSGKDLVAYWLHALSPRRDAPFIKVHCPSIPSDLLESELFGHERGAFTDARATKLGKIELAAGGSLYFDQIHDLDLALQAKLLRVVEERRFERLGGTRTLEVDVRFLSSSSVDLREAVSQGRFREDLYHRLGVVPLRVPALRERREDVLPLAAAFLAREIAQGSTRAAGFTPEAEQALLAYAWPGNVRELRASVERAALYARAEQIERSALPERILAAPSSLWAGRERPPSLREVEQAYIMHVLETTDGNQTQAAAVLGISRKALWEKRRRFGFP